MSCPRPRTPRRAPGSGRLGADRGDDLADRTAREPAAALADRDRDLELGRLEVRLVDVLALRRILATTWPAAGCADAGQEPR